MSTGTVLSYPIPAFQNVPIHDEYYLPNEFIISRIGLGPNTLIATTENVNFVVGQEVRLLIPPSFGCKQLNGKTGFITQISTPMSFTVSIDSSKNVTPFNAAGDATLQNPVVVPIGDVNTGATNANGLQNQTTFIPGSFINISPQ
jgi:hypothetical protein